MRFVAVFFLCALATATWLTAQPNVPDDAKILQKAGIDDDGAKMVEYFRRRVVTVADRGKIREAIRALGHESFAAREKASADVVKLGLSAVGPLREATRDKDVEIARRAESCLKQIEKVPGAELSAAAARAIAKKKPDGAADALLNFLPVADNETVADEVREALAALAVGGGKGDAALLQALDDAAPFRRAAAGEALIRANIADARRLMMDGSPEVRLRVALASVTRAKDKLAVAGLINLLAEVPRADAWRVEDVLIRLAGEQMPAVSLGKDEQERKLCRDKWAEWWSNAAAGTDLNKLDTMPRLLGYTLIVQCEQRNTVGQVYEVNAAGEVLWKIDSAHQPFDAVVLGNDRLLLVEHGSSELSLRDFRGNVIWRKQMMLPHSIQVLPNGRFLIASRGQIVEMSEKRDEFFKYERERLMDICASCKDKNGNYWVLTHTGDCFRVDDKKKETKPFKVNNRPMFGQLCGMEALANGHVLIAYANAVSEYDQTEVKSWSYTATGQLSSAQRLANGNTLIAGLTSRQVIEVDRKNDIVWEFTPNDGGVPRKARRR